MFITHILQKSRLPGISYSQSFQGGKGQAGLDGLLVEVRQCRKNSHVLRHFPSNLLLLEAALQCILLGNVGVGKLKTETDEAMGGRENGGITHRCAPPSPYPLGQDETQGAL